MLWSFLLADIHAEFREKVVRKQLFTHSVRDFAGLDLASLRLRSPVIIRKDHIHSDSCHRKTILIRCLSESQKSDVARAVPENAGGMGLFALDLFSEKQNVAGPPGSSRLSVKAGRFASRSMSPTNDPPELSDSRFGTQVQTGQAVHERRDKIALESMLSAEPMSVCEAYLHRRLRAR